MDQDVELTMRPWAQMKSTFSTTSQSTSESLLYKNNEHTTPPLPLLQSPAVQSTSAYLEERKAVEESEKFSSESHSGAIESSPSVPTSFNSFSTYSNTDFAQTKADRSDGKLETTLDPRLSSYAEDIIHPSSSTESIITSQIPLENSIDSNEDGTMNSNDSFVKQTMNSWTTELTSSVEQITEKESTILDELLAGETKTNIPKLDNIRPTTTTTTSTIITSTTSTPTTATAQGLNTIKGSIVTPGIAISAEPLHPTPTPTTSPSSSTTPRVLESRSLNVKMDSRALQESAIASRTPPPAPPPPPPQTNPATANFTPSNGATPQSRVGASLTHQVAGLLFVFALATIGMLVPTGLVLRWYWNRRRGAGRSGWGCNHGISVHSFMSPAANYTIKNKSNNNNNNNNTTNINNNNNNEHYYITNLCNKEFYV